ncbi:sulfatase [Horticoccus luteus]|uniref:Sulfatase n=1 Tax=Horticoccus luteus TaxID=2862869 RepID=A0A8F9TW49_9BACT|nr:sulfatase [Horticoccus luteus]QYM78874.1 sulfatase [Horticoccus luteus]
MKTRLSRREWLAGTSLLAASTLLPRVRSAPSTSATPAASTARAPNLLFFFPDQMRRQAMGFVGEDPALTPHIDRFSREGLYLPRATSTFPVCSPWRGMMMTGRFPCATGITNNCNSTRPTVYLHRDEDCVTDVLHRAGYHIGYIGKWHLTHPHAPYIPQDIREDDVKWDEFTPKADRHHIDYWYGYNAYDDHLRPRYWDNNAPRDGYHYVNEWSPEHETDLGIRYLENAGGAMRDPAKPFALWMSLNPPHPPYAKVPARLRERYQGHSWRDLLQRKNVRLEGIGANARDAVLDYFAAVTGVDEQFGRVLATLDRLNLADDTIVVFTSDHGDMMGSQGLMSKPYPYEEAFSIPLIIRWPGRLAAGRTDDLLFGTPDLMPTLLGLMGQRTQIPRQVQGTDYADLLLGRPGPKRPDSAFYLDSTDGGHRGVRTHRHTYVTGLGANGEARVRLFDNENDRYQLHNLAEKEPALAAELDRATQEWLHRIGDPWPANARA